MTCTRWRRLNPRALSRRQVRKSIPLEKTQDEHQRVADGRCYLKYSPKIGRFPSSPLKKQHQMGMRRLKTNPLPNQQKSPVRRPLGGLESVQCPSNCWDVPVQLGFMKMGTVNQLSL